MFAAGASPGRWLPLGRPLERTEVAAARIGRSIYVVGGFEPGDAGTNAVERYDIGGGAGRGCARCRWR